MADPISSLGVSNSLDCHIDDHAPPLSAAEPTQGTVEATTVLMSSAEPTLTSQSPSGAQSLVARFSPSPALPTPVVSGGPPAISQSSLSTSSGAVPGGGSYRVEGNVFQQQIESGVLKGSRVEVGTAYVQYGKDNDVQVLAARRTVAVSGGGYGITLTSEAGVARANLGEKNDDGSIGGNIGAGVELVGAEVTLDTPVASLTYGASVSASLSGSLGVRDADHDGKPEFCAKFSVPAFTAGVCLEQFW